MHRIMKTKKERIFEEIQIRIKQKAKIEQEIVELWKKYYKENG